MAYISIQTKFLGPTNYKGDRIKATSMEAFSDGKKPSVTIPYDSDKPSLENHLDAANKLLPEVVNKYSLPNIGLIAGSCEGGYIFTPTWIPNKQMRSTNRRN